MDSTLTLALMMKAKIVFERDSDFLCFPLSPISYARNDLSFLFDATASAIDLTNLSDFSTLVSMIPDDIIWPPSDPKYLWDAYADVLQNADLAQSARTADEEKKYEAALAVLYTTNPEGTRAPSAALVAYEQYRDAYLVAEQNYAAAKNTVETSSDSAVKNQWATQGPALLQAIDDANNAWIGLGYKAQVEAARGVFERLGAKSPELAWQQWSAQFDPNTNALTDAAGQRFYPSAPAPANVFEDGAVWQQFTLLGDEADQLVRQAPADLRSRLAPQFLDVAIQELSFEYASVVVKRAWFDPQIFRQRFWRFGDGHMVSDGLLLANGSCPAYVLALIFARNVQVRLATDPVRNGPVVSHIQAGNPLNLGFFSLHAATASAPASVVHPVTLTSFVLAPDLHTATVSAPVVTRRVPVTPAVAFRPMMRPILATPATSAATHSMSLAPAASAAGVASPALDRAFATIAQARLVQRGMPTASGLPASLPSAAQSAPPTAAVDTSTMYVLGFICQRIPKSPDPDQTLTWS